MSDPTQYEPGTVAVATVRNPFTDKPDVRRVTRFEDGWVLASDPDMYWLDRHGEVTDVRPLVVIDPEGSRGIAVEIAQRVGSALNVMPGRDISAGIEAVQAVLREFANPTPPKPAEPTGLGAVVEDRAGSRFVRTVAEVIPWLAADDTDDGYDYASINAVRVLSDGVQP